VTLLFTDIEGSTRAWEADARTMGPTVARHDALLRSVIDAAGGYVFKTVGDAFCAAFADPAAAVEAAVAIQRSVGHEIWPATTPVRVRIAVHTGSCDERDGDYFGRPVNRVARLEAIAHGGQTLVSGTTASLVADRLGKDIALVDLGHHRLKDLDQPEHVWQVAAEGLDDDFPALRSLSNPRLQTNISTQTTNFLGRDAELTEIARLLETARQVTIVGPGGVGKTRLALHAAVEQLDGSGDGVWLVELAPISNPDRVVATVTRALGIRDDPTRDPLEYLVDVCLDRDALIVLDNCEHTVDAVARLATELVEHCPGVQLIATSREPLNVRGEHIYRLSPLAVPDGGAPTSAIAAAASVELFVERAMQHDRTFVFDDANAPIVSSICRRLDGIPLAIELAAARLGSLSLDQLHGRLGQRFRILTGGIRTDQPRQHTLQALVDWSWDLLSPTQRSVLAQASVFSGSFDLDAAEGVLSDRQNKPWTILDHVTSLTEKSLIQLVDNGRYRLLETIREFAAAKLDESGDAQAVGDAHLAYYLRLAVDAEPHLRSHDQLEWWRRLDPEHDNIAGALRHALTKADPTEGLKLVVSLRTYWSRHGLHTVATHALDAVLDRPTCVVDARLHCRATIERAWHYCRQGLFEIANEHAERAIQAARDLDDPALLALALVTTFYDGVGAPERTLADAEEALSLATHLNDDFLTSCALQRRAGALRESDRLGSRRYIEQSLELDATAGDQDGVAIALLNLAWLDLDLDEPATARSRVERALPILATYPNPVFEAGFLEVLGFVELREHDADAARTDFERAFALARRAGDQLMMAESVLGCALTEPQATHAAVLHGAADALLSRLGSQLAASDAQVRDAEHARLRSLLGDDNFEANYERGRGMTRPEIAALTLPSSSGPNESSATL
jgi:predicted ATPase/class 3 adenylate cyclase